MISHWRGALIKRRKTGTEISDFLIGQKYSPPLLLSEGIETSWVICFDCRWCALRPARFQLLFSSSFFILFPTFVHNFWSLSFGYGGEPPENSAAAFFRWKIPGAIAFSANQVSYRVSGAWNRVVHGGATHTRIFLSKFPIRFCQFYSFIWRLFFCLSLILASHDFLILWIERYFLADKVCL